MGFQVAPGTPQAFQTVFHRYSIVSLLHIQTKALKKVYFYPISARNDKIVSFNPYTFDFVDSIEQYFTVVNKGKPSARGIFDIYQYIFRIDYIIFNWIEDLPEKKGGFIQTVFFFLLMAFCKLSRIKIIWVMHNRLSHSKKHQGMKNLIFNQLISHSNVILTHSSEGISYGESMRKGSKNRIHYFPHPVKDRWKPATSDTIYDILIWGTISPYKGILEFLQILQEAKREKAYRILIIGKSNDREYFNELVKFSSDHIIIKEAFMDDDSLQALIGQSKIVLFTYAKSSILSSGALMDSIGFGGTVVGPHVGAFADLAKEGIINTFTETDEMFPVIDEVLAQKNTITTPSIDQFLLDNSWNKFADFIHSVVKK
jgi:glycosyltransferase involved in cell wall biosynthesis